MTPMTPIRPLSIDGLNSKSMTITWNDGLTTHHTYRNLRFNCQCAICRDENTGHLLIAIEDIPDDIFPENVELMGTYALAFNWSDGHTTGIYSFDLLRRLDERDFGAPHTCQHHGTDQTCDHGDCIVPDGIHPTWDEE